MKKFSYFILGFSLFIFLISLIGFFLNRLPLHEEVFYTSVNVVDESVIGFNVDNSALNFGTISKGGSSIRKIAIDNKYDFPVIAIIDVEGDIEQLLNFDREFYIDKYEKKSISFSVIADYNVSEGNYSGNISFKILRG